MRRTGVEARVVCSALVVRAALMGRLGPALLASGLGVGSMSVWAQSLPEQEAEQEGLAGRAEEGQLTGAIGAALVSRPRYEGAETDRVRLAPLLLLRYDNLFLGPLGLGWAAIHSGDFRAGPMLGYEGGRRESSDPRLYGLGDIHSSVTGGVFAIYRYAPFEIGVTMRQALTHRDNGLNGVVRFEYILQIVPHEWQLRLGPRLEFSNGVYEQTRFGVTALQSAQSGLPIYTPSGGIKDVGLRATLTYLSTENLVFRGFLDISRLAGDTADSPIVLRREQHFAGVGLAYHF